MISLRRDPERQGRIIAACRDVSRVFPASMLALVREADKGRSLDHLETRFLLIISEIRGAYNRRWLADLYR